MLLPALKLSRLQPLQPRQTELDLTAPRSHSYRLQRQQIKITFSVEPWLSQGTGGQSAMWDLQFPLKGIMQPPLQLSVIVSGTTLNWKLYSSFLLRRTISSFLPSWIDQVY